MAAETPLTPPPIIPTVFLSRIVITDAILYAEMLILISANIIKVSLYQRLKRSRHAIRKPFSSEENMWADQHDPGFADSNRILAEACV